jgi:hypothetical protein
VGARPRGAYERRHGRRRRGPWWGDPRELLHGQGLRRGPKQHGESELLDEVVSAKPKVDRTRHHSAEELKEDALRELRDAVELLERKATPEEVDDYRGLALAERVAEAHKERGER